MIHITGITMFALCVVPFPGREILERERRTRHEQWREMFSPVVIDEKLAYYLSFTDPRNSAFFTRVTSEHIAPWIIEGSEQACSLYFRDEASPFSHGKRAPVAYSLAPHPGRQSLLLYEWESRSFDFQLLESSGAVLLRVRPVGEARVTKAGFSGRLVGTILEKILHRGVFGKRTATECFRLPDEVRPGDVFTNSRDYGDFSQDWHDNIVGFMTHDDLCLVIIKVSRFSVTSFLHPPENEWLPRNLWDKEGGALVIERLWGKRYPPSTPSPMSKDRSPSSEP